jgi:hypothetical protein
MGSASTDFFTHVHDLAICSGTFRRNDTPVERRNIYRAKTNTEPKPLKRKKPPRMRRRGGPSALRRAAPQTDRMNHHLWCSMQNGRPKAAVFFGNGAAVAKIIVMRRSKRPWQDWQRPTLPSLET